MNSLYYRSIIIIECDCLALKTIKEEEAGAKGAKYICVVLGNVQGQEYNNNNKYIEVIGAK